MVFYFTGTGNSLHAARVIAQTTGDDVTSMAECLKKGRTVFAPDERLGFVFPVYFMGLPDLVRRFLERFTLAGGAPGQIYIVTTCGFYPGGAAKQAAGILKKKGLLNVACYSVKTTHIWTPHCSFKDKAQVGKRLGEAEQSIFAAAQNILYKRGGKGRGGGGLSARLMRPLYERARQTHRFSAGDTCIGCGVCARNCPSEAIEIREGRPVWTREKCSLCLACLHRCPKFAVRYAGKSCCHGQYLHPCVHGKNIKDL